MKHLPFLFAFCGTLLLGACVSETDTSQQKQLEDQIKSDEAKMDSLQKAIQAQMESVSDDSVLSNNTSH